MLKSSNQGWSNEMLYEAILGTEKYMTNYMSIDRPLGPIEAATVMELLEWVSDYNRRTKYPNEPLKLFAIGFYQIHQGMKWRDGGVNKYESYAASALHFMRIAAKLGLAIEEYVRNDLCNDIFRFMDQAAYPILKSLSETQQQLFYVDACNKVKSRRARYNQQALTESLGESISLLIKTIPPEFRVQCFYEASRIMTKEI